LVTQYLGVRGDAAAGIVTLSYEHRNLEDRLQELSYGVASEEDYSPFIGELGSIEPGVIVSDSRMPEVSGLDLLHRFNDQG
jgi:FixJ family two-component response regulator